MKRVLTRIAVRVEEAWGFEERSRVGSAGGGVRSCAAHNMRGMWGMVWFVDKYYPLPGIYIYKP
jgi:hypothetical protein